MAEAEGAEFQRKVALGFFTALLVAGVALYWGWGIMYDTWNPFNREDIGIYTLYVPMIAFGLIGILLYRKKSVKA
jgi:uncharacterized membrane protein YphA (DoxX/SURF4 family)